MCVCPCWDAWRTPHAVVSARRASEGRERLDHGDGVDFNLRALGERGDFDRRARGRVFGEACVVGTNKTTRQCVRVCVRE